MVLLAKWPCVLSNLINLDYLNYPNWINYTFFLFFNVVNLFKSSPNNFFDLLSRIFYFCSFLTFFAALFSQLYFNCLYVFKNIFFLWFYLIIPTCWLNYLNLLKCLLLCRLSRHTKQCLYACLQQTEETGRCIHYRE